MLLTRRETRGVLELELVPVTDNGSEFTLMLRGQPLPRAEVTLVAPPRWERKLRNDAQGRVSFETPWAGRYVAEVIHVENTPGGIGDAPAPGLHAVLNVDEGIASTAL